MNRLTALFALTVLAAPLAAAAPSAAWAQLAAGSKAPVDVTADQLVVEQQQCRASYKGAAEALQDTSRLRADTIDIFNKMQAAKGGGSGTSCGQLDRMEADGSVYYVTPDRVVKGDHAIYNADSKTIVVTGQVVVAQGKNVSAGARLVINTDLGQATMESGVKGRGNPGRVRTVLYPNEAQGTSPSGLAPPVPPPPRKHGG
ncbi:LptA/OstA family protein [Phenylobacterium montanum]|uniref:Organic solvent tolerance protein OstA n=1 Tax=Phenylobacterium montanum TaxID=2823693 RepID=A0A975FXR5_9CAUL|nr:LptA/OstA family protein [Caulobacter sp. S6]QUD86246.1 organic solvent tolerance protein OstA [Caulobacter sp. S6]